MILLEPLRNAHLVIHLLAIFALDVLFLDNVEADRANKGVDKLLVGLSGILLGEFVVACETKDVVFGLLLNCADKVARLLFLVFFEPGEGFERPIVMH